MRGFSRSSLTAIKIVLSSASAILFTIGLAAAATLLLLPPYMHSQAAQREKLPKPRQLDKELACRRNPTTNELVCAANSSSESNVSNQPSGSRIAATTRLVPVTCSVFGADGSALNDLAVQNFRIYDDGVEQPVAFFSPPSKDPAGVALVIDASPSVLRDAKEMTDSARALMDVLSRNDEVAVVDFSAHTYLQLGFSNDRDLLSRAVSRVDVRSLLGDTGGSNIYAAVYLTAHELFAPSRRHARNAIVLFTDGQDSGLGLTLDPASAATRPGSESARLTYEDVVRTLAAGNIQVFAISTENRPKIMTPKWLASHRDSTLIVPDARKSGIPAYTLYLAELARSTGGQIYFLHEAESMAETFQQIGQRVNAEYWLGFTPGASLTRSQDAPPRPGWHSLRVEIVDRTGATVVHRTTYYVSGAQ